MLDVSNTKEYGLPLSRKFSLFLYRYRIRGFDNILSLFDCLELQVFFILCTGMCELSEGCYSRTIYAGMKTA